MTFAVVPAPLRRLLSLIALLGALLMPHAAFAAGQPSSCAIGVMVPGKWMVTYEQKFSTSEAGSGFHMSNHARLYGTVIFDVACDGTAVTTTHYDGTFELTSGSVVEGHGQSASCEGPVGIEFSNAHFSGPPGGFPSASMTVAMKPGAPPTCSGSPATVHSLQAALQGASNATRTLTWTISRTEATADPATSRPTWLSGHPAWSGAPVPSGSWFGVTMVPLAKGPDIQSVNSQLKDVFLADIGPVMNTYSINVPDWGGAPGTVLFTLEKMSQTVSASQMNGNLASVQFDVSTLSPGDHTIHVVVTNGAGKSTSADTTVHINPVPDWAKPFGLIVDGITTCGTSDCVRYSGHDTLQWPGLGVSLPDIEVPSAVPFIGGKWGFQPLTFNMTINPRSALASADYPSLDDGPITGAGGFNIAGNAIKLDMRSDSWMRTPMTSAALMMTQGEVVGTNASPSDTRFEDPAEKSIQGSVDLLTLIPGASNVYKIPVVGGFLQETVPSIVDYTVTLNVGGAAALGAPDGHTVKLTGGQIRLDPITATVGFGPNTALGGAQVQGQFNGMMVIGLTPPALQDCTFTFLYYLLVGSGQHYIKVPENPTPTTITKCQSPQGSNWEPGRTRFAAISDASSWTRLAMLDDRDVRIASDAPRYLPSQAVAALPVVPPRDGWVPETVLAQRAPGLVPKGRAETLLLHNANAFAASPSIAIASGGRAAMAWISENPSKARPLAFQVKLRLFDGNTWSHDIAIGDGSQPNESTAVAFDKNGQVIVAWGQTRASSDGYGDALTATSYDRSEIVTARVDPASHAVTRFALTNDQRPDADPQLATATDGTVVLAWRSAEPGGKNQFELCAATWSGSGWSTPDTLSTAGYAVHWQLAAGPSGRAVIVADIATNTTRKVVAFLRDAGPWSAHILASGLPFQGGSASAYGPDGNPIFVWSTGKSIIVQEGGAQHMLFLSKTHPLALSLTSAGLSLIMADSSGVHQADRSGAGAWSSAPLTRPFSSLTATAVARSPGGNWAVVRAEQSNAPASSIPQNADLIINMRTK